MATRRETLAGLLVTVAMTTPSFECGVAAYRPNSRPVRQGGKILVLPAKLSRPRVPRIPAPFVPVGEYQTRVADFDYVEEEWFATGVDDQGRPYSTQVYVRRPRDPARFSGTLIVEPLHPQRIAPIYMYSSPYLLRAGHAWACVVSQKIALDTHLKRPSPGYYAELHIETDPTPPSAAGIDLLKQPVKVPSGSAQGNELEEPAIRAAWWNETLRYNQASNAILAQVGAALRSGVGPFADLKIRNTLLVGHSSTGFITAHYINEAHASRRLATGGPVFDGYFCSGMPLRLASLEVPLIQLISEGDVADGQVAFVPGSEGRKYRRPDSDRREDRYRLYELPGVPHMGTRYPPHSNPAIWQQVRTAGAVSSSTTMNSMPHHELFDVGLHHLVRWVDKDIRPPKAARMELAPGGRFLAKDANGNTRGGVRSVQLDVPRATYYATPRNPDGTPAFGTVGTEIPFGRAKMAALYGDPATYVARFGRRLDELVRQGWFLAEFADKMRDEAKAQRW